ncbi:MAG TPA: hypothetical protein VJU61_24045 [Polyangiaceae bacterium]|nr:hypothetical protein [Polyangiaceae bacterium]
MPTIRARAAQGTWGITFVLAQSCVPTRAPTEPDTPLTLADASAACQRLQANGNIPVSCTADYIDDVPSIIVGFRNREEAQRWLGPFAEHIGDPFCQAANRSGREARVYMTVGRGNEQQARRWSCELAKWGDWFANPSQPSQPSSPAAQQTVADAVRACNQVQANREVPVSCRTDHINGVPSMIVGFPTEAEAEAYMPQVAERIAGPFCDAANRANRHASFYLTLADSRARHYDCELQRWSDWFQLSPSKAVSGATQRL